MFFNDHSVVARGAQISLLVLVASVVGFAVTTYRSRIPPSRSSNPALQFEPRQVETKRAPFRVVREGNRYDIQPVYDYEITGLIVTDHDSSSFLDLSHAMWKDFLNTKDICVVWGTNVTTGQLKELNFTSGDWTCWVQADSGAVWQSFNPLQLSNNHVLPANEEIDRALRKASVGDEIRIRGHLVNYNINGSEYRNSSTRRDDTGNGACEILYVNEIQTLARHNGFWVELARFFKLSSAGAGVAALISFLILPLFVRRNPVVAPSKQTSWKDRFKDDRRW